MRVSIEVVVPDMSADTIGCHVEQVARSILANGYHDSETDYATLPDDTQTRFRVCLRPIDLD